MAITANMSTDFSLYFSHISEKYRDDPQLFRNLKKSLKKDYISYFHNQPILDITDFDVLNAALDKNIHIIFHMMYLNQIHDRPATLDGLPPDLQDEIYDFLDFIGPIIAYTYSVHSSMLRQLSIALSSLKESVSQKRLKVAFIISEWLIKWSAYLQREDSPQPFNMNQIYHQGDVVLVDFGFRIGSELGGRHYAVVMEKNNNPKNPVIFLTPISSLKPGRKVHPKDVDLGALIHDKPSFAVLDQSGTFSKIRIEKHLGSRRRLTPEKIAEISSKLKNKL